MNPYLVFVQSKTDFDKFWYSTTEETTEDLLSRWKAINAARSFGVKVTLEEMLAVTLAVHLHCL